MATKHFQSLYHVGSYSPDHLAPGCQRTCYSGGGDGDASFFLMVLSRHHGFKNF